MGENILFSWYAGLSGGQFILLVFGAVLAGIVWSVAFAADAPQDEAQLPEGEGRLYEKAPRNAAPAEIETVRRPGEINRFTKTAPPLNPAEPGLKLFGRGEIHSVTNLIKDISAMPGALYFNYDYTVVLHGSSENYRFTVGFYKQKGLGLPEFQLRAEKAADRLLGFFGDKDIDPEWDPVFSKRFYLTGPDRPAVAALFAPDLAQTFNRLGGRWQAQGAGDCVIVFKEGFLNAKDYARFMAGAASVFRAVAAGRPGR
jgi:hypothetical protein